MTHLGCDVPDATVDAIALLASVGECEPDAVALPLQLLMLPQIGSLPVRPFALLHP